MYVYTYINNYICVCIYYSFRSFMESIVCLNSNVGHLVGKILIIILVNG